MSHGTTGTRTFCHPVFHLTTLDGRLAGESGAGLLEVSARPRCLSHVSLSFGWSLPRARGGRGSQCPPCKVVCTVLHETTLNATCFLWTSSLTQAQNENQKVLGAIYYVGIGRKKREVMGACGSKAWNEEGSSPSSLLSGLFGERAASLETPIAFLLF